MEYVKLQKNKNGNKNDSIDSIVHICLEIVRRNLKELYIANDHKKSYTSPKGYLED